MRFSFNFTIYATVLIKKAVIGNYLLLKIRRNESVLDGNCACFVIVIRRYFSDYYKITNRLPRKYSRMEKQHSEGQTPNLHKRFLYVQIIYHLHCLDILYVFLISCVALYVCTHWRVMSLHVCNCIECSRVPKSYVEVCSSSLQHKTSRLYNYKEKQGPRKKYEQNNRLSLKSRCECFITRAL